LGGFFYRWLSGFFMRAFEILLGWLSPTATYALVVLHAFRNPTTNANTNHPILLEVGWFFIGGFPVFLCAHLKYCRVGYRQPQPTPLTLIHTLAQKQTAPDKSWWVFYAYVKLIKN
jgi:hypothetical protein